ncbi:helix-turn-helix domain-containing protein [Faecalicatena contorta]|uniref:helix-turn-helix domain-containing protein n=1 Tax=Faecalicatena contorta TaxID=39482 RepID=UPI001F243C64|nr:helix-turn-helix transcriptional regulator [Faecalicatena contorta]MCF2555565.1 helix-turn-helix transcriptional regulator [Faecalicatena contorta]
MNNTFGERLKKVRKAREYTQDRLSEECGICVMSIIDWEKGRRYPNAYYLSKICVALNVSADYLIGLVRKNKK